MVGPGGNALRMTRLILLGMIPLVASGGKGVFVPENADGHSFLRNGSGRDLQSDGGCGGDLRGIRSSGGTGKICCVEECGQCGGVGCSGVGREIGLTADDCCTSEIKDSGVMCSDANSAPCIIESSDAGPEFESEPESEPKSMPTTMDYEFVRCSAMESEDAGETAFYFTVEFDDLTLSACHGACAVLPALYFAVLEGNVCACGDSTEFLEATDKPLGECDIACPGDSAETCGGSSSYNLYKILSSGDDASASSGDDSSSDGSDPAPTCSSGIVGVESESGNVCCSHKCGTCGGDRCVGWGDCCEDTIQAREEMCSDTNEAPCIYSKVHVETPPPAPLPESQPREERSCSNGLPGVESADGATCCWKGCVECKGYGEDCVGVTNCCEQAIHDRGVYCSDEGIEYGPCIM